MRMRETKLESIPMTAIWNILLIILALVQIIIGFDSKCENKSINILLHAQASLEDSGFIVGSLITCTGFRDAFQRLHPENIASIVTPFNYKNIDSANWDIVLIEGWFPSIHQFIHEVRRLTHDNALVFFYCLDPEYPGLEEIMAFDVDGYFTNSKEVKMILDKVAPSQYMMLASKTPSVNQTNLDSSQFNHTVVYVGSAVGMFTKKFLPQMLREAMPFGLVIYGSGWEKYPEFSIYWKGILPQDQLFSIYLNSKIILGVTMDKQREKGMINNRVFEVLACDAILISEYFPALEEVFQDKIFYAKKSGDVTKHLKKILDEYLYLKSMETAEFIRSHHTYDHRVIQIVEFAKTIRKNKPKGSKCFRKNCYRVAILWDSIQETSLLKTKLFVETSLKPAIDHLEQHYIIQWIDINHANMEKQELLRFHVVLVYSNFEGSADRWLRKYGSTPTRKGLILKDSFAKMTNEAIFYDVIYYTLEFDRPQMSTLRTNFQHAFGITLKDILEKEPVEITKTKLKSYDVIALGDWKDEERLLELLSIPGSRLLVLSQSTCLKIPHTIDFLRKHSIDVSCDILTSINFLQAFKNSKSVFIPGSIESGGEWIVLLAAVSNISVQIWNNSRLEDLNNWNLKSWDINYYKNSLRLGISRMFCMGKGNSSIRIGYPYNLQVVGKSLEILPLVENFNIQVDGIVCLSLNGFKVGCLLRPNLFFKVLLDGLDEKPLNVHILLKLRSNIYSDYITQSDDITIIANNKVEINNYTFPKEYQPVQYVFNSSLLSKKTY